MILIGVGSNIPGPQGATPRQNCHNALKLLEDSGVTISRRSRWYRSSPIPPSDQPWFINGVVAVEAAGLEPEPLLELLHQIELEFGRRRSQPNAPRPLDLDILDFDGRIIPPDGRYPPSSPVPHPRPIFRRRSRSNSRRVSHVAPPGIRRSNGRTERMRGWEPAMDTDVVA